MWKSTREEEKERKGKRMKRGGWGGGGGGGTDEREQRKARGWDRTEEKEGAAREEELPYKAVGESGIPPDQNTP